MLKRFLIATATAGISLAAFSGAADAAPGKADGTCVAQGVKALGGATISVAANGTFAGSNVVPVVIKDHVFNKAGVYAGLTGADC